MSIYPSFCLSVRLSACLFCRFENVKKTFKKFKAQIFQIISDTVCLSVDSLFSLFQKFQKQSSSIKYTVYMSVHITVFLPVCVCLPICLSISVCMSVYPYFYLSVCQSIHISICLYVCLSVCRFFFFSENVHMSVSSRFLNFYLKIIYK